MAHTFLNKVVMSQATQIEFKRLVTEYFQRHNHALNLAVPTFEEDGFITTASMIDSGGRVEFRCGAAEYHTEIFVYTLKDQKRWNLAELMSIESVRNWMLKTRPNTSDKSRLEAEVDYAFCLLTAGLKGVGEFGWLYRFS